MKKVIFFLSCFLINVVMQAQTSEPMLTMNTQMHTSQICRISTDTSGRYLLTASFDKTARLWDAATGALLQIFRPPAGPGNEGMLYACALSPDAKTATMGGWSYFDKSTLDIYVFNTSTGQLIQRIGGQSNVIDDLEYSADGHFLAASLGNGVVNIFKKNDTGWTLHTTLTDNSSDSYSISFAPDGRFATVCYDGKIRLYSSNFALLAQTTGSGAKPQTLAFSPDAERIAVGYADVAEIDVFDGKNLKLLFKPTVKKMNEAGGLDKVCFSSDGRYLYAGGSFSQQINHSWWNIIRQWSKGGKGAFTDYPACGSGIQDIKSITNGDMIVGGAQPDFCRLDLNGNKINYREGEIQSFNVTDRSHLKTNLTGDKVAFTPWSKKALQFSISTKSLTAFQPDAAMQPYSDKRPGVVVSEWQNSVKPKINETPIPYLKQHEICRSVDIATTNDRVVIGASWSINCFDPKSTLLWKTDVQAEAWAVNISGNGRCVAATLGNGLINWYSMADGKLLLSLYAHPDNKRWVLWTPSGYYDCAPGAEDLIGWHLNNGPDHEAYFFPASKFRDRFFRPDIIENILVTYDEQQAISLANAAANRVVAQTTLRQSLPPVVRIIAPAPGEEVSSTTVTLKYSATSPNGE
ncbi:MAG: hypothetical protein PHQ65_15950, partial [Bacteroidales bacterium]|nr:hypothetical protein [Bacteroidales bacterium]